jgi:hypothetical protein
VAVGFRDQAAFWYWLIPEVVMCNLHVLLQTLEPEAEVRPQKLKALNIRRQLEEMPFLPN